MTVKRMLLSLFGAAVLFGTLTPAQAQYHHRHCHWYHHHRHCHY